jgi:hypothetical protein
MVHMGTMPIEPTVDIMLDLPYAGVPLDGQSNVANLGLRSADWTRCLSSELKDWRMCRMQTRDLLLALRIFDKRHILAQ